MPTLKVRMDDGTWVPVAEGTGPALPQEVFRTSAQNSTTDGALSLDTVLMLNIIPGIWRVEGFFNATGPAAADFKFQATATGGGAVNATGSTVHAMGPSLTTTNVADGPMRMMVNSWTAVIPFGTDGSGNGASIRATWRLNVTASGLFRISFGQNTANATVSVMNAGSWLIGQQLS